MSQSYTRRLGLLLCLLSSGLLFQTSATTCESLGASAGASLSVSIVNSFIRNAVQQAWGLGSPNTNLNALTNLTTTTNF